MGITDTAGTIDARARAGVRALRAGADLIGRRWRAALVWGLVLALGACETPAPDAAPTTGRPAGEPAAATAPAVVARPSARAEPEAASAIRAKPLVRASRQMVVAAHPLASEAGIAVLRDGGSAVDAAIAAQLVLTLVEPQSSGIGGGGFLLSYRATDGALAVYDGRETAPRAAHPRLFLDAQGRARPFAEVAAGGLAVGVPGLLRQLEMAHRDHGRLPWARLFAPAIRLAEEGFPVGERLHTLVRGDERLADFPAARAYFLGPDGRPWPVGHRLRNPDLAATLRSVAAGGSAAFYEGPIARDIVAAVREGPINPGTLALEDLATYRAVKRDALCAPYRQWLVCGAPPPTTGGVAVLQMLGMLQRFELGRTPPLAPSAVHLIAEAGRLAHADRMAFVADPAFVAVPTAELLDPGYLMARAGLISTERALSRGHPGNPLRAPAARQAANEPEVGVSTSHLSVVDAEGNAVAFTTSIESAFGSRLFVRGFLLNNHLTDFSFRPEGTNGPAINRVEPGKRPRSSMAPTLVFGADGRLALVAGSPGGSQIIGYVANTLIAMLDWSMDAAAAVAMPHFGNRDGPTELEAATPIAERRDALRALGHDVRVVPMTSGLHVIRATASGLEGGADPRREGSAIGD